MKQLKNKELLKQIKQLKLDKQRLEKEIQEIKSDRQLLRHLIVKEFQHQLSVMSSNQYWKPEFIIKRLTEGLNKVQSFYLGL